MPAKPPPLGDVLTARLQTLGEHIRAHRKQQNVSAAVAAEAAGLSRVTFHRIERGEPAVTMGAYLSAIDAVGLQVDLRDPHEPSKAGATKAASSLPGSVPLAAYPQLKRLAWQQHGVAELSPRDALSLYERNWRHIDPASLEPTERALLDQLVNQLGGGRLLV